MNAAVESTKKIWTEAELQALPDEGYIHEVVDGELVLSPKNNFQHEEIGAELLTALRTYAKAHRLGAVLGSSFGCWMHKPELPRSGHFVHPQGAPSQVGFHSLHSQIPARCTGLGGRDSFPKQHPR